MINFPYNILLRNLLLSFTGFSFAHDLGKDFIMYTKNVVNPDDGDGCSTTPHRYPIPYL